LTASGLIGMVFLCKPERINCIGCCACKQDALTRSLQSEALTLGLNSVHQFPKEVHMNRRVSTAKFICIVAAIGCLMIACAKPYHFYVKYDLPEPPAQITGQTVYLLVQDTRVTKQFLSEKARNEFDLWDGTFALYHAEKKPAGYTPTYRLTEMIAAAITKRLESVGVAVSQEKGPDMPLFELTLDGMQLDLEGRTWVSEFSYQVKLTRDNQKVGREKVSGKAERTKVMGRRAGELLVGDIISESLNKLDIEKLFKNAGL
jgi:hypothetical protein